LRRFWISAILSFTAVIGCSKEVQRTETSVWWAPLVTFSDSESELTPKVFLLLAEKGIDPPFIGGHGQRFWAPIERHPEAVALLKAAPYAGKLRIHLIEGGPRPGAKLARRGPADGNDWTALAGFKKGEVNGAEVIRLLNNTDCEVGLVTFGTHPENTSIWVPSNQEAAAKSALKSSPFTERLRYDH
jgi:hypothetical protein